MVSAMSPIVSVVQAEPRPIAVIVATTSWSEFPSLWGQLLGEVWWGAVARRVCANIGLMSARLDIDCRAGHAAVATPQR